MRLAALNRVRLPSSRLWLVLLLVAWSLLVWWLLTGARIRIAGTRWWGPWLTNFGHAPLFGVQAALLAVLLCRPGDAAFRGGRALLAAVLAMSYGVLLEWVQAHTPGRRASGLDALTDAVGAWGVPWALALGTWWNRRATVVLLSAALTAAAATWWR
ncbi:MAG: VanZ family protein [Planctomycetota bacterium]